MTHGTPPAPFACASRTAWHPLFIGYVRSFLPAGRVLGANIHLAAAGWPGCEVQLLRRAR